MAVRKRGDRWWVDIHYSGQRIRKSCGPKATRADALEYEQKILSDLFAQRLGKKRQRLLAEVATNWIKGDLSRLKSRQQTIEHLRMLGPHIHGKTLQEAPEAAREVIEDGIRRGNTNATINRRLALLRRLCNLAYRWEWIDAPIRISLLREHSERHIYLTVDQVQRLADTCTMQAARDMVLLAAFTGLRRSELFKLTADNLRGDWIVLDADTKSGKPRSVPVSTAAVGQIMQRMPLPITVPVLRRQFESARVRSSMPQVRFHDLRHTYASWLVQSGVPLRAVQELLGHSTIAVTQRYAHLAPAHLADGVAQAMRMIGADSRHESVTAEQENARK